jgi:hypothetical protein
MTLTEFLLARIAEDEARAHYALSRGGGGALEYGGQWYGAIKHAERWEPARALAECAAKRAIITCHESWPVLVEGPIEFGLVDGTDPHAIAYRATQQIAWATQAEYRKRFGTEPPTTPMLRALALPYADHPDYRDEWA